MTPAKRSSTKARSTETEPRERTLARRSSGKVSSPRPAPDLEILQTQVFRGPNYYSYDQSIRLLVDLGSLERWPSNTIDGFNDTLLELLPGVGEHSCSRGHAGGFRERLEEGTWAGHVAEHIGEDRAQSGFDGHDRGRGAGEPRRSAQHAVEPGAICRNEARR